MSLMLPSQAYHGDQSAHKMFASFLSLCGHVPARILRLILCALVFSNFSFTQSLAQGLIEQSSTQQNLLDKNTASGINSVLNSRPAEVRLISETPFVPESGEIQMGFEITLASGWKTYWRSPGDAGLPARLNIAPDGQSSEISNVAAAEILWPLPKRFSLLGVETIGYEGTPNSLSQSQSSLGAALRGGLEAKPSRLLILPLKVTVAQAQRGIDWSPQLDLLLCSEICIPESYRPHIRLGPPPSSSLEAPSKALLTRSDDAARLATGLARMPEQAGPDSVLKVTTFHLERIAQQASFVTTVQRRDRPFQTPDVFIEISGADGRPIPVGGAKIIATATYPERFEVRLRSPILQPLAVDPTFIDSAILTIRDGFGPDLIGLEMRAPVVLKSSEDLAEGAKFEASGLLFYLAMAWLGGLILNVMPCVLPVLSLKLLSLVGASNDSDRRQHRSRLLTTSGGMIFTFVLLALVLIGFKSAGELIGWGVQFQSPIFLSVMCGICALMGLHLLGALRFLGRWMMALYVKIWEALAQSVAVQSSLYRAQKLPMTSRMRQSLSDAGVGALSVLLATPCSAPFVGVAAGFALTGTSMEIITVFTAMGLGFATPFLALACWQGAFQLIPQPGRWMLTFRRCLAFPVLGLAVWLGSLSLQQIEGRGGQDAQELMDAGWVQFDPAAIEGHVAAGKTVVVTLTADWCLTCKINKAQIYAATAVRERLATDNIIRMVGDWTQPDKKISDFLAMHNRAGIPFDIVYGPEAPLGIILPELLTTDALETAILSAQRRTAQ